MSLLGWIIVIVGALVIGAGAQLIKGMAEAPYRWVVTAVAAFVGAVAASEWLFAGSTPDLEGIALWPALIGGIVAGIVVDLIAQRVLEGSDGRGTQGHGSAAR